MNNFSEEVTFETPRAVHEVERFTTNLRYGAMCCSVARFERDEMIRVTRGASNFEIPSLEQFERYLFTLLLVRVDRSNNVQNGLFRQVSKIRVPSRWFVLLSNVGVARDHKRRFEFVPNIILPDGFTPMTIDELNEISWLMESLLQEGYSTVPGVPKDPEGSLAFMAKSQIGDFMRGIDVDNPVYAFLASILEADVVSSTVDNLDLVFRIQYSSFDTYEQAFRTYFKSSVTEEFTRIPK